MTCVASSEPPRHQSTASAASATRPGAVAASPLRRKSTPTPNYVRQFPNIGDNSGNGQQQTMQEQSQSQAEFVEASRNMTASVNKLSDNIATLSAVLNVSVGTGLVGEMSKFSGVMETMVGEKMTASVSELTRTLDKTVADARLITTQIDETAKSASRDLNTTVGASVELGYDALKKIDRYVPEVQDLISDTVQQADGWVRTIDSWAIKVIISAVALTALLSSGIIFVLGCCCLKGCFRFRRRRHERHKANHHQSSPSASLERRSSLESARGRRSIDGHLGDEGDIEITIHPNVLKATQSIGNLVSSLSSLTREDIRTAPLGPPKAPPPGMRRLSAEGRIDHEAGQAAEPRASMEVDSV
eukprot:CAMPEP_0169461812 /NCGR_PEP_ID=MMETSP1042-20121227/19230_1 /TAXON_ID=464988 /ORGANISM="Hemiselmis andersenii, Strain CCMP1180" /LENGTH=358 /DNA_ID=CAMNT_0009574415 /DNA_START=123 /DNA_END=1195 /DNA_ORIENTATION=+